MRPHIQCTLSFLLSVDNSESIHHNKTPMECRGSACVDVITTLQGSISSLRRRVRGCVPQEGTIALTRDPFKKTFFF